VNGIGSTRQLSNDSQSVVQTTTYDAFGNIESSAGSSNNVYKFAGQHSYRNDGDDGLMYVGERYYDPLVGRFVQTDDYLGSVGNPQSLNLCVYVENNPVNMVDPTGRAARPPDPTKHPDYGKSQDEYLNPKTTPARRQEIWDEIQDKIKNGSPKEKSEAKKRARYLERRSSKRQQHHFVIPESEPVPWWVPAGVILYWVISEGSRLFLPRNLVPAL